MIMVNASNIDLDSSMKIPSMIDNLSKGIFILSLNSERFLKFWESRENRFNNLFSPVKNTFIIIDEFEINNLLFFTDCNLEKAKEVLSKRLQLIKSRVEEEVNIPIEIKLYSEIKQSLKTDYFLPVYQEYHKRGKFFREVNNQIFKNLHPKLKRMGVKNSRNTHLEMIAPFLLAELAVLLYYTQSLEYKYLFSVSPEMQVFIRLINGTYLPELNINNTNIQFEKLI